MLYGASREEISVQSEAVRNMTVRVKYGDILQLDLIPVWCVSGKMITAKIQHTAD